MFEDIHELGVKAAGEGLTLWDCPYYRAHEMPGHTGESIPDWRRKVEAWESGWRKRSALTLAAAQAGAYFNHHAGLPGGNPPPAQGCDKTTPQR